MTFDDKFYDDLIDSIYAAGLNPQLWQDFLERISVIAPENTFHIHGHDFRTSSAALACQVGISPEALLSFVEHYSAINPYMTCLEFSPVEQPVVGDRYIDKSTLLKSEFYNEWLLSQAGAVESAGIVLHRDKSRVFALRIRVEHVSAKHDYYNEKELAVSASW
ncbi:hypothetical protein WNY59_08485 [Ahrensia kielensis]|uniref:Uncharacterized protein n=1 Tax=Ahrensia kielensis TaxID=76980 RepID=A0ABU9T661_9HYPH